MGGKGTGAASPALLEKHLWELVRGHNDCSTGASQTGQDGRHQAEVWPPPSLNQGACSPGRSEGAVPGAQPATVPADLPQCQLHPRAASWAESKQVSPPRKGVPQMRGKSLPQVMSRAPSPHPGNGVAVTPVQGTGKRDLGPTTPMRSPRPYSPASRFLPSSFRMTERSRPLRTM